MSISGFIFCTVHTISLSSSLCISHHLWHHRYAHVALPSHFKPSFLMSALGHHRNELGALVIMWSALILRGFVNLDSLDALLVFDRPSLVGITRNFITGQRISICRNHSCSSLILSKFSVWPDLSTLPSLSNDRKSPSLLWSGFCVFISI